MSTSTQSPKRSGSPLEAIDLRSTKKPETTEDTREAPPATLEFLPDSHLPPTQDLERLNGLIHHDVQKSVPSADAILSHLILLLQILGKHCYFLDAQPRSVFENNDRQTLHKIVEIARDAYQRSDYSRLMLLKCLSRSPPPKPKVIQPPPPFPSNVPREVQEAIIEGWNAPFIGTAHTALARNIQEMFKESPGQSTDFKPKYMTHASIIQSSGSGKSRLLDKVAETIFTIPFNVRDPREASGGAWPPADDKIHSWAMRQTRDQGRVVYARYLGFFTALFDEVRKEVEQHIPQPASASTASAWRTHLAESWSEHRTNLYSRVLESDTVQNAWSLAWDADADTLRTLRVSATGALEQLLDKVCPDEACRKSHTDKDGSTKVGSIHVLIYFDEAHVLAQPLDLSRASLFEQKTALEVLYSVLDDFRHLGVFGVFMSTQSHLEHLESKGSHTPYSPLPPSARRLVPPPDAHAPITETPFDCFGDRPIIPSRLRADDLCDIPFMACFGRPMWRSLLLPLCDEVLADATGTAPQDPSRAPYGFRESLERRERSWRVLDLAQVKLVYDTELKRGLYRFCRAAQVAVLDVRIMLPFEPRSSSAYCFHMELVASHMRTVHSIPQHWEYVRSGYPSEPILAEAAARQLHSWRTIDEDRDPAALILVEAIKDGLLDLDHGAISEAVGRMLLILARDRAAVDMKLERQWLLFSRAVPVSAFIKALFPPTIAQAVLNSRPDNLPVPSGGESTANESEAVTFAEAFKDAVVNFTHFAKWAEGLVPDMRAAVGCFVRSMAVVCRKHTSKVDVFIPVLLDRSAPLRPQVMTAILVRINFKRGKTNIARARAAYPINEEEVGLFNSGPSLADKQMAPPRPYITLVMELGVDDLDPPSSRTHTGSADVKSSEDPVPVDVGQSAYRHRARDDGVHEVQHPRYSITAYGCSPAAYGVVRKNDLFLYQFILRRGGPLLEHWRQDADSLDLVRMLKPAFSTEDASWSWTESANSDDPAMDVDAQSAAPIKE